MPSKPSMTLSGPDLAALLCSRVCHDVISPVGAINNGLELLDEGGADEDALGLIRSSAVKASMQLRFARLAFGASGSAGASIDTGEAENAIRDMIAPDGRTKVEWTGPRAIIPKNRVKLLMNLFLLAFGAIPRGGLIRIELEDPEGDATFTLTVSGRIMRLSPHFSAFLNGTHDEDVDAHSIQAYYTVLLASEIGMKLSLNSTEEEITFKATF